MAESELTTALETPGPTWWWANLGRSFDWATTAGRIWAGTRLWHHQTVGDVAPGDIVVGYAGANVRAIGVVQASGTLQTEPIMPSDSPGERWTAPVDFWSVVPPVGINNIPLELRRTSTTSDQGPFQVSGRVHQLYLGRLSTQFVEGFREMYDGRLRAGTKLTGTALRSTDPASNDVRPTAALSIEPTPLVDTEKATTLDARACVDRILSYVVDGLGPFVEQSLAEQLDAIDGGRLQTRVRNPGNRRDPAVLLGLLRELWHQGPARRLSKKELNQVHELSDARNRWAHHGEFDESDLFRIADSAFRLLEVVGSPRADDVRPLRTRFARALAGEDSPRTPIAPVSPPRNEGVAESVTRAATRSENAGFQDAVAQRVASNLVVSLRKHGRSTYLSHDRSTMIIALASKRHPSAKERYWFGVNTPQLERLENVQNGYFAFGCGTAELVFLVPASEFSEWSKGLNSRDHPSGGTHWHVQIEHSAAGYELRRKGGFDWIALDPYRVH